MGEPDPSRMTLELMTGSWVSHAMYVAAELGIADLLAEGPLSIVELASASGCAAADGLYRVLRLLASHNVFHEHDVGRSPSRRSAIGCDPTFRIRCGTS
jgi:hypothetical protein